MKEYEIVTIIYGTRVAERSRVPLMNHIDEGLEILDSIGASDNAKRAWCLHPVVQNDEDLKRNFYLLSSVSGDIVALAMEYRRVANNYLSTRPVSSIDEIELSPLKEVNQMLYADKIQNKKDFEKYHKGTHPRSCELEQYFENWINKLKNEQTIFN